MKYYFLAEGITFQNLSDYIEFEENSKIEWTTLEFAREDKKDLLMKTWPNIDKEQVFFEGTLKDLKEFLSKQVKPQVLEEAFNVLCKNKIRIS